LELVVVIAVDEDYLVVFVGQLLCQGDTGETGAYDDDSGLACFGKVYGHGGLDIGLKCKPFLIDYLSPKVNTFKPLKVGIERKLENN
jgi:hypothetical protein